MMIGHSLRVAMQTLRENPLRTLLSTLGVVIGVGSLVAILSLGDGLEQFSRNEIATTTDLQVITVEPITTDRIDNIVVRREQFTVFTHADERELAARLGDRAGVGTSLSYASFWQLPADSTRAPAIVTAATPGYFGIVPIVLIAGRLLDPSDMEVGAPVAVVSPGIARALGDTPAQALDRSVRIGDTDFRVIGVAGAAGQPPTEERVGRIAIPLAPAAALPGLLDIRTPSLTVRAADVTEVDAIRISTEHWLADRFGDVEGSFTVSSNVRRVEQAQRGILIFKLVMGAITGISLLVGGIGIMNVLLASITERTREIGIRRATGARRRDIRHQFLAESLAISGLGAGLGLLLGLAGSLIVMEVVGRVSTAPIQPVFALESMALAVVAALAVGMIFGMYPAIRASRLSPIEALRHE